MNQRDYHCAAPLGAPVRRVLDKADRDMVMQAAWTEGQQLVGDLFPVHVRLPYAQERTALQVDMGRLQQLMEGSCLC